MSNVDESGRAAVSTYNNDLGENTIEALVAEQGADRPVMFWALAVLLLAVIGSLPFVEVNLWVNGRGVVRGEDVRALDPGAASAGTHVTVTIDTFLNETDVKFLRVGQTCVLRYDAYPYTEWGTATGTILEVSNNPVLFNRRTLFKVTVQSANTRLYLPDGRSGDIAAGMSTNVRIIVNRKSLLNVIYQKTETLFGT